MMLTAKQQAVLDVIRDHAAAKGYPPTVREIGTVLGLASSSTVHSHIAALERAGFVERDPSKPRALKLADVLPSVGAAATEHASQALTSDISVRASVTLPLVGQVAAGAPLLAEEHLEDWLQVPEHLVRSGESFLLRIRGESMINVGIFDNDYVVIRRQPDASQGEIVVALVDDEATCKRFFRRDGVIVLQPENDAMEPIIPDVCEIIGVVTGVMRSI
ncbi:MAG: transcriptional repressor LexA [Thermoleophilia bacterium]|nr:transcriptional repressor LexA [Thermoleophilia bacterium]